MLSCNDGFRPVSFLVEAIGGTATDKAESETPEIPETPETPETFWKRIP